MSPDNPGNKNVLYFGEIRDDECVFDQPDVFDNAVKFYPVLLNESLTVGDCPRYEVREYAMRKTAVFFCENGYVQCAFDFHIPG